jgi:hypothetical protein
LTKSQAENNAQLLKLLAHLHQETQPECPEFLTLAFELMEIVEESPIACIKKSFSSIASNARSTNRNDEEARRKGPNSRCHAIIDLAARSVWPVASRVIRLQRSCH